MPLVPPVTIATRAISCPFAVFCYAGPRSGRVLDAKKNPDEAGLVKQNGAVGSEAELGSDVYRLAVLLSRLFERGEPVAFLRVAYAGGDIEVAGQAIAARDVDRL